MRERLIVVKFGESLFSIALHFKRRQLVVIAKELVLEKLKSSVSVFRDTNLYVDWLTLYASEEDQKAGNPILADEMPAQEKFWATLAFAESKSRFLFGFLLS
jgi:hypothetical protein